MLCTQIEGNLNDPSFEIALRRRLGGDFAVDAVTLDWDETRRRVLRVTSESGLDVGIRLGDAGLSRGLADGDVLGVRESGSDGRPAVVVVRLRSAEVLQVELDRGDVLALAHAAWEIGNMHAPLFRGDELPGTVQLLTPRTLPLERVLVRIPGVRLSTAQRTLDQARRFTAASFDTVVRCAPDLKVIRRSAGEGA